MKTPESYEKAAVKKYLDSIGAFYFSPYMAGYGKRGVPDIVACIMGHFWGLELKRPGGKPTALQKACMAEILGSNGLVAWGTAEDVIGKVRRWWEPRVLGTMTKHGSFSSTS